MPESKFNANTNWEEISNNSYWLISSKQKKCWDKDQECLFGSHIYKASVCYNYIPAEFMEENVPYIISSSITYDGGKSQKEGIEKGDLSMYFHELKSVFILNKFQ